MTTATVTGPIYGVSQTFDFISMSVIFELSHWDSIDDVGLIASGPIIVPVDENGDFSVDLVLNTAGSQVTNYQCFLQYRKTDGTEWIREPIGVFALSVAGTYKLGDLPLISVEGVETSLDVYAQITSILASVTANLASTTAERVAAEAAATSAQTSYNDLVLLSDSFLLFTGDWQTAISYSVGNVVTENNVLYVCLVDHTSDVFSTDEGAGNWDSLLESANPTIQSLSTLGTAPNKGLYTTGVNVFAEFDLTAAGRALLDDADKVAQRTTLGLGSASIKAFTDNADLSVDPENLVKRGDVLTAVDAVPRWYPLTAQTVTPGDTALTWVGLPAGVKGLRVQMHNVTFSVADSPVIQLGDSGGFKITGYYSGGADANGETGWTTGFLIYAQSQAVGGEADLSMINGTNIWTSKFGNEVKAGGGSVDLAGTLTQLRLVPSAGSTFQTGTVGLEYYL